MESPLKFATTSICCFGDGKGFVVGSIEGRCGVNYYDLSKSDKGKSLDFCFKCHRIEDAQKKTGECYSVNGFAFNQKYNTLVSLGSDGTWTTWNKDHKSKYKSSKKFPSPMTAGDFSWDGNLLAYAIGYDWSMGAEGAKAKQYQTLMYIRVCDIGSEVHKP
jgi:mRNA export factor